MWASCRQGAAELRLLRPLFRPVSPLSVIPDCDRGPLELRGSPHPPAWFGVLLNL